AERDDEAQKAAVAAGPFRETGEYPGAPRHALDLMPLRQVLGLDQRHIDGARAFLLAGLARDAEIHRLVEAGVGEGCRVAGVVQRRLEGGDARLGRMLAVAGDAVARTHHAASGVLAVAAVHADGDGLGVVAAGGRNARIGIADAVSV